MLPSSTTLFTGPGESNQRTLLNRFVRLVTDRALEGKGALHEWQFTRDPDGVFAGLVDVFGDRSVWAIHVPGRFLS